jgi:hypothetical protein
MGSHGPSTAIDRTAMQTSEAARQYMQQRYAELQQEHDEFFGTRTQSAPAATPAVAANADDNDDNDDSAMTDSSLDTSSFESFVCDDMRIEVGPPCGHFVCTQCVGNLIALEYKCFHYRDPVCVLSINRLPCNIRDAREIASAGRVRERAVEERVPAERDQQHAAEAAAAAERITGAEAQRDAAAQRADAEAAARRHLTVSVAAQRTFDAIDAINAERAAAMWRHAHDLPLTFVVRRGGGGALHGNRARPRAQRRAAPRSRTAATSQLRPHGADHAPRGHVPPPRVRGPRLQWP